MLEELSGELDVSSVSLRFLSANLFNFFVITLVWSRMLIRIQHIAGSGSGFENTTLQ